VARSDRPGGAITVECGGWSRAALRFFEPGDGALRCRWTCQGTPQPWSGPSRGSCRPAKGCNGAVPERSRPPFLRARAAAGHGASWIMDSEGVGKAGGQRRNPWLRRCRARLQWSMILWRCGREPSREWSSRIRLQTSGQGDTLVGLVRRPANATSGRSPVLTRALPTFPLFG
jgi:hypothetical protein